MTNQDNFILDSLDPEIGERIDLGKRNLFMRRALPALALTSAPLLIAAASTGPTSATQAASFGQGGSATRDRYAHALRVTSSIIGPPPPAGSSARSTRHRRSATRGPPRSARPHATAWLMAEVAEAGRKATYQWPSGDIDSLEGCIAEYRSF